MVDAYAASPVASSPARPILVTPTIRVGDVLSGSWRLFVSRFGSFTALALVAFAPHLLFVLLAPSGAASAIFPVLSYILEVACTSIAHAAIIYGVIQVLRGRGFTFGESMRIGLGRFGPILGLSLLVGVLAVLGLILLIVPGFIVATMFAVAIPVCVAERAGVGASMKRSAFLTKGNRWRIFAITLLVAFATSFVVGFIVAFLARLEGAMVAALVRYPMVATLGAFNAVVAGVLYHQLRMAKEGVDIEKIAAVFD